MTPQEPLGEEGGASGIAWTVRRYEKVPMFCDMGTLFFGGLGGYNRKAHCQSKLRCQSRVETKTGGVSVAEFAILRK